MISLVAAGQLARDVIRERFAEDTQATRDLLKKIDSKEADIRVVITQGKIIIVELEEDGETQELWKMVPTGGPNIG